MNKRHVFLIVIIILVTLTINVSFSQNDFKVGDASFTLPEGYKVVENGKYVNISNGHDNIILRCNGSNDIKVVTDEYVKYNEEHNLSISMSTFASGVTTVYKAVMDNNTDIVHYWFNHDGKIYEIYTRNANSNTEEVVSKLINSAKT